MSGLKIGALGPQTVSTRIDRVGTDEKDPEAIGKAATSLEAFFLDQVLKEVRGGAFGGEETGGFAGGTFREMLDQALSQKMAERGVLGLRPLIGSQLGAEPETTPRLAPPRHTPPVATIAEPPSSSRGGGR